MKYEKIPTEDYDDDARELQERLSIDDTEANLPLNKSDTQDGGTSKSIRKTCNPFIRKLHVVIGLIFVTIIVFTFLPSLLNTIITFRHNRLYGGSCRDKYEESKPQEKENLYTASLTSPNPSFPYIQLSTLPPQYIPTKSNPNNNQKLIIIGDVHGMLPEFQELLKKLDGMGYLSDSHVVLAGDMISKGSDSVGLLDMAIGMNASCVRGNHEDSVMRHYWRLQKKGKLDTNHDEDEKSEMDDKDLEKRSKKNKDNNKHKKKDKKKHKNPKHRTGRKAEIRLAKSLTPAHAQYIDSCPLIIKMDHVSGIGDVAVVHAGVVPGVPLPRQKPSVLMNIRTFIKKIPTPSRRGVHWSRLWNEYQRVLVRQGKKPLTIVYGHDARRGLEVKQFTKGLDTNCVRGGRLTALVIRGGKKPTTRIVSVKCRKWVG